MEAVRYSPQKVRTQIDNRLLEPGMEVLFLSEHLLIILATVGVIVQPLYILNLFRCLWLTSCSISTIMHLLPRHFLPLLLQTN